MQIQLRLLSWSPGSSAWRRTLHEDLPSKSTCGLQHRDVQPKALDARQAARALRMAGAGRSVREVAKLLGCSPNTAHRAIRGRR